MVLSLLLVLGVAFSFSSLVVTFLCNVRVAVPDIPDSTTLDDLRKEVPQEEGAAAVILEDLPKFDGTLLTGGGLIALIAEFRARTADLVAAEGGGGGPMDPALDPALGALEIVAGVPENSLIALPGRGVPNIEVDESRRLSVFAATLRFVFVVGCNGVLPAVPLTPSFRFMSSSSCCLLSKAMFRPSISSRSCARCFFRCTISTSLSAEDC